MSVASGGKRATHSFLNENLACTVNGLMPSATVNGQNNYKNASLIQDLQQKNVQRPMSKEKRHHKRGSSLCGLN